MEKICKLLLIATAVLALACTSAMATSYNFIVDYSGNGVAALDPSSPNNPLATTLQPGDTFEYTFQAVGKGAWTVHSNVDVWFLAALWVNEPGSRTSDYTLNLLNNNSIVFQDVETGVVNEEVHLGTNVASLTQGLVFNSIQLTDTITSALVLNPDGTYGPATTGSTPASLTPIFGAPEALTSDITFNPNAAPVPEPSTILLIGAGFAGLGLVRRRTKK